VRLAVINGPNLNLLGRREPGVYGHETLAEINGGLEALASELDIEIEFFQSNNEGRLIDYIQEAAGRVDGFLVNAGGYTHTSVALLDALVGVGLPYIEVHLSNLAARERYRRHSLLSGRASGVVFGFGPAGYTLAMRGLVDRLRADDASGSTSADT
jgi:3-dehydroquinate dehydratase-2